jgi:hypothetical protein
MVLEEPLFHLLKNMLGEFENDSSLKDCSPQPTLPNLVSAKGQRQAL